MRPSAIRPVTLRRYRRREDRDVWHFYEECPEWPHNLGGNPAVIETHLRDGKRPGIGLVCRHCLAIEAKRASGPKRGRPPKARSA